MGISVPLFRQLAELGSRITRPESAVMLGRQAAVFKARNRAYYKNALRVYGHENVPVEALFDETNYAEPMLEKLGFGAVKSMDFSDYEGAEILHDMNQPLPQALHNRFDFVLDGGTLEHVFNVAQSLTNVFNMLKVGGTFVSATPFNGWPGHGFYQFQPDLVWSFWKYIAHCEVVRCIALPNDPEKRSLDLPDNKGSRRRRQYDAKLPEGRVFLYYEVRKLADSHLGGAVLQADYETKWEAGSDEESEE
jgi:SAM-dependent methyltransferase